MQINNERKQFALGAPNEEIIDLQTISCNLDNTVWSPSATEHEIAPFWGKSKSTLQLACDHMTSRPKLNCPAKSTIGSLILNLSTRSSEIVVGLCNFDQYQDSVSRSSCKILDSSNSYSIK